MLIILKCLLRQQKKIETAHTKAIFNKIILINSLKCFVYLSVKTKLTKRVCIYS